jgi:hypothetical protein
MFRLACFNVYGNKQETDLLTVRKWNHVSVPGLHMSTTTKWYTQCSRAEAVMPATRSLQPPAARRAVESPPLAITAQFNYDEAAARAVYESRHPVSRTIAPGLPTGSSRNHNRNTDRKDMDI